MSKLINNLVLCSITAAVLICCQSCSSSTVMDDSTRQALDVYGWQSYVDDEAGIWVSVQRQELLLVDDGNILKRYRCSTSRAGTGSLQDSGKTPLGWHRIGAKIGDDLPAGAVLKDRRWTGQLWRQGMDMPGDLIVSRILRLEGLEDSKNRGGDVDTWNRYIYIHGTNRTDQLGKPASSGCIRLDPRQVIDLYNRVDKGCCVLITKE